MRFGLDKIPSRWNTTVFIAYDPLRGAYILLETFRLWIPWCYPSTTAHSFDIPIPVAAQYRPSNAPEYLFTSDSLHHCRYIAVAQVRTCGEGKVGKAWQLAELAKTALCDGMGGDRWYAGWMAYLNVC